MWAKNGARTRDLNLGKVALYQLSYFRVEILKILKNFKIVRMEGLEPTRREALDPKSSMATNYITSALDKNYFSFFVSANIILFYFWKQTFIFLFRACLNFIQ